MVRKRVCPCPVFVSQSVSLGVQVSGMLGVLGGTYASGEVGRCAVVGGGGSGSGGNAGLSGGEVAVLESVAGAAGVW